MSDITRKLKTGSKEWLRILQEVVVDECPPLVECVKCGRVTRQGYVCRFCDCDSPGNDEIRPQEWM